MIDRRLDGHKQRKDAQTIHTELYEARISVENAYYRDLKLAIDSADPEYGTTLALEMKGIHASALLEFSTVSEYILSFKTDPGTLKYLRQVIQQFEERRWSDLPPGERSRTDRLVQSHLEPTQGGHREKRGKGTVFQDRLCIR